MRTILVIVAALVAAFVSGVAEAHQAHRVGVVIARWRPMSLLRR